MNKLKEKIDPKYLKICVYASVTVIMTIVALAVLYFSGGFWKTFWSMFTAVLTPVVIGGIICYLFLPVVDKLEKLLSKEEKPWRRPAAVAIFYGGIALILIALIILLFILLKGGIDEIRNLDFAEIKVFIMSLYDQFSTEIKSIESLIKATDLPIGKAGDLLTGFINAIASFFSGLLFGVIFSIYFMLDGKNISRYWKRASMLIAGEKLNSDMDKFAKDADRVFSGYIRGQFLDALLVGVVSSVLLTVGGVPYAVVIGILVGIGNLIPYVGPVVGYGAVAIICLIMGQFDKLVIGIVILAAIMFVDGNVINPRLLSDNVEVHPLLVIAALLAGGAIGGFAGMLVAVPVAALVKLQFDRYLEAKEQRIKKESEEGTLV